MSGLSIPPKADFDLTSAPSSDAPAMRPPVLQNTRARIIPRDQHPISRSQISENALKVLYRLISAGHQAFLVGGGIRDLLVGLEPKDFDIATDASPEEVRDLFRNARLIGRRFRLAHVRFGREIIEVATFRGSAAEEGAAAIEREDLPSRRRSTGDNEPAAALSGSGMILRDNVYGTVEDDAIRRDFTINALYYTPADFCVYDFAGGVEDIEAKLVRLIGDPVQRYREDPVRILRALRFAAKLDFDIEAGTSDAIDDTAELLLDVPPARLFDEVVKLLLHGKGVETFELLWEYEIFDLLFPESAKRIEADPDQLKIIDTALANTDRRIAADQPVTPGFLYAALLWPAVEAHRERLEAEGETPRDALYLAGGEAIARQQAHTSVPKRFSTFMRETWELQPRLESPNPRQIDRVTGHPRFRAAYDFLVVREQAGHATNGMADWWTRFQAADEDAQRTMLDNLRPGAGRGSDAPPKRRRRRRKPAGS